MSTSPKKPPQFLPLPVDTTTEDPFRDDVLGRRPIAENLTKLVSTFVEQPFVMGINGTWGSGKTKFLEMWGGYLRQQGFRTLYFNAWENDHADDPFAAVLSEFRKLVDLAGEGKKTSPKKLWDKVAAKSVPILQRAAAGLVKNLTLGILDLQSADAEAFISGLAEESAKHALEKCADNQRSIEAFRSELQSFVKSDSGNEKPVVYFVDELDRCRPTFAIAVLERIKHLLNVPGVVFVFAWDRQQLDSTVRAVYGDQADTGGYLIRFVDLEFSLPVGDYSVLCKALMKRFDFIEFLHSKDSHELVHEITKKFPIYAARYALSVREQEKIFIAFSILCRISVPDESLILEILLVLLIIRVKSPRQFQMITSASRHFDELVARELPAIFGEEMWQSRHGGLIEGLFIYECKDEFRASRMEALRVLLNQKGGTQRDQAIYDGYVYAKDNRHNSSISGLIRQMAFVSGFSLYL